MSDKPRLMPVPRAPADRSPYRGHRFPPEIIAHAVWLYFRFPLSFATFRICWPSVASWSAMRRFASGAWSLVPPLLQDCDDDAYASAISGIWTKWRLRSAASATGYGELSISMESFHARAGPGRPAAMGGLRTPSEIVHVLLQIGHRGRVYVRVA